MEERGLVVTIIRKPSVLGSLTPLDWNWLLVKPERRSILIAIIGLQTQSLTVHGEQPHPLQHQFQATSNSTRCAFMETDGQGYYYDCNGLCDPDSRRSGLLNNSLLALHPVMVI